MADSVAFSATTQSCFLLSRSHRFASPNPYLSSLRRSTGFFCSSRSLPTSSTSLTSCTICSSNSIIAKAAVPGGSNPPNFQIDSETDEDISIGGSGGGGFDGGSGSGSGGSEEQSGGGGEGEEKKKAGMSMSQKLTLGYAALVGLGGIMGYLKSGSQKSLAAGGLAAALLYLVYAQLPSRPVLASATGLGISAALLAVMGSRFKRSGKVFPAGVVSVVSLVMTGGYLHGIFRSTH